MKVIFKGNPHPLLRNKNPSLLDTEQQPVKYINKPIYANPHNIPYKRQEQLNYNVPFDSTKFIKAHPQYARATAPVEQKGWSLPQKETYWAKGPDGKMYQVAEANVNVPGEMSKTVSRPVYYKTDIQSLAYAKIHTNAHGRNINSDVPLSSLVSLHKLRKGIFDYYVKGWELTDNPTYASVMHTLRNKFPANEGWEITPEVSIYTDDYSSKVDLVARRGQEVQLINFQPNAKKAFLGKVVGQMQSYMYQQMYPDSRVTGSWQMPVTGKYMGQLSDVGPIDARLLNSVYGLKIGPIQITKPVNLNKLEDNLRGTRPSFFPKAKKDVTYFDQHVTFDIETDDAGNPIQVAAHRYGFDAFGQLHEIGTFEHYYKATSRLSESAQTHRLTEEFLNKVADHKWNTKDQERLMRFMQGAKLVGQNILEFDLPHMFTYPQVQQLLKQGVIDIVQVARNYRPSGTNDLEKLLYAVTHKTPTQLGLTHHGAGDDVLMEEIVLLGMKDRKSEMGRLVNALLTSDKPLVTTKEGVSAIGDGGYLDMSTGRELSVKDIIGEHMADVKDVVSGSDNKDFAHSPDGILSNTSEAVSRMAETMDNMVKAQSQLIAAMPAASQSFAESAKSIAETFGAGHEFDSMKEARWLASLPEAQSEVLISQLGVSSRRQEALRGVVQQLRDAGAPPAPGKVTEWRMQRLANKYGLYAPSLEGLSDVVRWNTIEDFRDEVKERKEALRFQAARERAAKRADLAGHPEYASLIRASGNKEDLQDNLDSYARAKRDEAFETRKGHYASRFVFGKQDILNASDMNELTKAMHNAKVTTSVWTNVLTQLSKSPIYDFTRWAAAGNSEIGGVLGAARGVIPKALLSPLARVGNATSNLLNISANKYNLQKNVAGSMWGAASLISGTAGALITSNPMVGMGINAGVQALGSLATMPIGLGTEFNIRHVGETVQEKLNLTGALIEYIKAPLNILGTAIAGVVGAFAALKHVTFKLTSAHMRYLQNYGTPWTALTGLDSYGYRRTRVVDMSLGLQVGATNNLHNTWASAQQGLYTMGNVDTSRLIAASMLGEFSSVYAPGGKTEEQIAGFMNRQAARLRNPNTSEAEKAHIMYLAEQVSPNAPQMLTRMNEFGMTYEQVSDPASFGVYSRAPSNKERIKFHKAYAQWQMQGTTFHDSMSRIMTALWNPDGTVGLNHLATIGNKALDNFIQALTNGASLKTAFSSLKNDLGEVWDRIKQVGTEIKEAFGGKGENIFDGLWNTLLDGVRKVAHGIIDIWSDVVQSVWKSAGGLVTFVNGLRIEWDGHKPRLAFGIDTSQSFKWNQSISTRLATEGFTADPIYKDGKLAYYNFSYGNRYDADSRALRIAASAFTPAAKKEWESVQATATNADWDYQTAWAMIATQPDKVPNLYAALTSNMTGKKLLEDIKSNPGWTKSGLYSFGKEGIEAGRTASHVGIETVYTTLGKTVENVSEVVHKVEIILKDNAGHLITTISTDGTNISAARSNLADIFVRAANNTVTSTVNNGGN